MSRPIIVQQIDDRVETHGDIMFGSLQLGLIEANQVPPVGIIPHDLTNIEVTPQSFGNSAVNFFVQPIQTSENSNEVHGIVHFKGAQDGFGAWELAGNVDGTQSNRLFYRQGIGPVWGDWKEIAFLDSVVAFADRLTCGNVGEYNIPTFFVDGQPVSSDYDLHILLRPSSDFTILPSITNITIADKLSIDAGLPGNPVYFFDGIPVMCSDILNVSITGLANMASALETPRNLRVLLSSTTPAPFDGTADVLDIGIDGILTVSHGGTGTYLSPTAGGIIYGAPTNTYTCTPAGQVGQILLSGGMSSPTWLSSGSVGQLLASGGASTAPTWLTGTIGAVDTPVYLKNGVLTPCETIESDKLDVSQATTTTKYYLTGVTGAGTGKQFYTASPYSSASTNKTGVYFQGSTGVLYGAAWNDYAEYRKAKNKNVLSAGHVVVENGDDTLSLSTKRLQPVPYLISDTFGMIIGIEEDGVPVALAGRALAFTYEDRQLFKVGQAVCSGPKGTVSIMTDEEKLKYPECILGYVSAVPDYEIWGPDQTAVNGRIWIKIK